MYYTLVQHSAYPGRDEFAQAVEEVGFVARKDLHDRVRDHGGLIYADYLVAAKAAEIANDAGVTPNDGFLAMKAPGTFIPGVQVNNLWLYIPDSTLRAQLEDVEAITRLITEGAQ